MKELSGSYEALFSKRAKKFTAMDLKNEIRNENVKTYKKRHVLENNLGG